MKVAIYALLDRNADTRYIGKSVNPERRVAVHRWGRKWVANYEVIEWCEESNWKQREIYWIWKYGAEGYPLCNRTIGGEGLSYLSEEDRKRRGESLKRAWQNRSRVVSAGVREKIANTLRGRKLPIHVRQKLSEGMKGRSSAWLSGRKLSEESIKIRTSKQRGLKRSPETRKRLSESKRGAKNPRYGLSPWNAGKPHSEQTKQRLREAWVQRKKRMAQC